MWRVCLIGLLLFNIFGSTAAQSSSEGNCPDSQFTEWGMNGVVTPGDSNNVRAQPSTSAALLGQIAPGEPFNVNYNSAICADGYLWIGIVTPAFEGWTTERPIDGSDPFVLPYAPEPRVIGELADDGRRWQYHR